MFNYWALVSLIVTWLCILVMFWICVRQFREVRRPKNEFTLLRYYLFFLPIIVMVGSILRLQRLNDQLHAVYSPTVIRASVGATMIIVAATVFMVLIYTYRERK